jgi:hypothetical protein
LSSALGFGYLGLQTDQTCFKFQLSDGKSRASRKEKEEEEEEEEGEEGEREEEKLFRLFGLRLETLRIGRVLSSGLVMRWTVRRLVEGEARGQGISRLDGMPLM